MKLSRFLMVLGLIMFMGLGLVTYAQAVDRQTYVVQPGDTMAGIAARFYGNTAYWPRLWEMNRNQIANPNRISPGDILTIYPLSDLVRGQGTVPPPPPANVTKSLYDRGRPLDTVFPRYFTFVADTRGVGGTGVTRMKVKKLDPLTGQTIITYDEVRQVGEVISSMETGYQSEDIHQRDEDSIHGKLLLAYNDDVVVRFTEDLAKVLDSATHEDPDPYFREFPIYGLRQMVTEPDQDRHDAGAVLGQIHEYKGKLTVVARVEGLSPMTASQEKDLAKGSGMHRDSEPASYVAKVTYSVSPINVGDRIFVFRSLSPGPERELGGRQLHQADQYRPPMP